MTEFGENSTYFSGSVADRDHYYQQQDLSSHQMSGPQHLLNQGESLPWTEKEMDMPSIDELSGIGQAQHLADTGVSRRDFDGPPGYRPDGIDGLDGHGLAALGVAVEMMEPAAPYSDLPKLTFSHPGGASPKRSSGEHLDHDVAKTACKDFDVYSVQHDLDIDDGDGPVQCRECGKMKARPCDLRYDVSQHCFNRRLY